MKLGEFIKNFSHNNMIRLHYKMVGGYKSVHESQDDVSMDWEIVKGLGINRHYINNEVVGLVGILYTSGHYTDAINIVIEELENQPYIDEVVSEEYHFESHFTTDKN